MKLYVPEIGDKLKLTSDWSFDLYWEYRNEALIKYFFGEEFKWRREDAPFRKVTLLAGTVLTVNRIYIRQGASEYSSISFYANISESGKSKSLRFWAKLSDCNRIEFSLEKSAPNLKLVYDYNIRDIKEGEYAAYGCNTEKRTSDSREGLCNKVISASKQLPVLKVRLDYELRWEESIRKNFLGIVVETSWTAYYKNPRYTLLTMGGKEIGQWKSLTTLKKNAKEYVIANGL